jgi:hypothetical protein
MIQMEILQKTQHLEISQEILRAEINQEINQMVTTRTMKMQMTQERHKTGAIHRSGKNGMALMERNNQTTQEIRLMAIIQKTKEISQEINQTDQR